MSNTEVTPEILPLGAFETAMMRARASIASGLSSSARRRDNQVVFARASDQYLWDTDGRRYIDCVCAHGPILLGHSPAPVIAAVSDSIRSGVSFGGPHSAETDLAEEVLAFIPWAAKVAYTTTGSEAVQLALRIARVSTARTGIVKFDGHFHGWIDPIYVNSPGVDPLAGSSLPDAETDPDRPDLPAISNVYGASPAPEVRIAPWNDLDAFRSIMARYGPDVAAVVCEPYSTNFGTFAPDPVYLQGMVDIAHEYGAMVIFDEIVSGFRLARGGAAERLGVTPDLATHAKALGSGFPISLVAGTADAMSVVDSGVVLTAGTYSGTAASVHAALATVREIDRLGSDLYQGLDDVGAQLKEGLESVGRQHGLPIHVNRVGSLAQVLWGNIEAPDTIAGVNRSDKKRVALVCEDMIRRGVYSSRKGLFYLTAKHTSGDIDEVVRVFESAVVSTS